MQRLYDLVPGQPRWKFFALASTLFVSTWGSPASADTLGVDLEWARPLPGSTASGPGFGLRYGKRLAKAPLMPELAIGYLPLGGQAVICGSGGLRVSVGSQLKPGLFVHAGYAGYTGGGGGLLLDGGATLDFELSGVVLGAHGRVFDIEGATALAYGGHVELRL